MCTLVHLSFYLHFSFWPVGLYFCLLTSPLQGRLPPGPRLSLPSVSNAFLSVAAIVGYDGLCFVLHMSQALAH